MADLKKKVKDSQGNWTEATIIEIEESTERFNNVKLKDGTVLNVKTTILEVVRLDQWDDDGNPLYGVESQTIVTLGNCPDDLKKPSEESVK